ncbi:MAG: NFACT family protein [Candidatus Diapherotrites archaeon]|nr:NFACT family protein [Candidatus Diapherotrites archaeon]
MTLSSLETNAVARELADIKAFFSKFQTIKPGVYKLRLQGTDLVLAPAYSVHSTRYQHEAKTTNSNISFVRKSLQGSKLTTIAQHGFDRVLTLHFDNDWSIILELFGKGNVVLVDPDGLTRWADHYEEWKDREIKPKKPYIYPKSRGLNPKDMKYEEFEAIFKEKDVIRSMASEINLSAIFLEEACFAAGVDKNKQKPTGADKKKLFNAVKDLANKELKPGTQGVPVPFPMHVLEDKFVPRPSFNDALDEYYAPLLLPEEEKKSGGVEHRYQEQEEALKRFEREAQEFKEVGDWIYAHFQEIETARKAIERMRKQGKSDKELTEALGKKARVEKWKLIIDA